MVGYDIRAGMHGSRIALVGETAREEVCRCDVSEPRRLQRDQKNKDDGLNDSTSMDGVKGEVVLEGRSFGCCDNKDHRERAGEMELEL